MENVSSLLDAMLSFVWRKLFLCSLVKENGRSSLYCLTNLECDFNIEWGCEIKQEINKYELIQLFDFHWKKELLLLEVSA